MDEYDCFRTNVLRSDKTTFPLEWFLDTVNLEQSVFHLYPMIQERG